MKDLNKNRVINKLQIIQNSLSKLKSLSNLSENEFLSDFKYYDSTKYNFIQCIEAIIDISNPIIARKRLGIPKTYYETFEILGEKGIFPKEYINTFKNMAKFRNKLVHFYTDVKDVEVYRILRENLGDIEKFVEIIEDLILK